MASRLPNDNTAGTNTIAAFDRNADGSLSPVPGSPFAAGGAGTGKGLASQGALQLSSDGRYLIAVDAGSKAAGKVGELVAAHVIARPHEDLAKVFLGDVKK